MKTPTFNQNMSQLYSLKEQLIKLHQIFSPDTVNYNQMKIIGTLREEVQSSKKQINSLQESIRAKNAEIQNQVQVLQIEKDQLEEVNMQLVNSNEKMVEQLQAMSARLQKAMDELAIERQARIEMEARHAKQLDNMKLMHHQELYILKKKEKKGQ